MCSPGVRPTFGAHSHVVTRALLEEAAFAAQQDCCHLGSRPASFEKAPPQQAACRKRSHWKGYSGSSPAQGPFSDLPQVFVHSGQPAFVHRLLGSQRARG